MKVATFTEYAWSHTSHEEFETVFGETLRAFLAARDIDAVLLWDRNGPYLVFRTETAYDKFTGCVKTRQDIRDFFGRA